MAHWVGELVEEPAKATPVRGRTARIASVAIAYDAVCLFDIGAARAGPRIIVASAAPRTAEAVKLWISPSEGSDPAANSLRGPAQRSKGIAPGGPLPGASSEEKYLRLTIFKYIVI
jgi:hypothetical protein